MQIDIRQRALADNHQRPLVRLIPEGFARLLYRGAAQRANKSHAGRQIVTPIFQRRGRQLQETIATADQGIAKGLVQRPATGLRHRGVKTLLHLINQGTRGVIHQLFAT